MLKRLLLVYLLLIIMHEIILLLFVLDLVGLWVPRRALGSQRGNPRKIGRGTFGRAPQGREAPLWMLFLFNVVVLCLRMHTLRAIILVLCTLGVICVLFHHSHIFPTFSSEGL